MTLVVYDLEYTAWEGSAERDWSRPGELREVVQIGAVRLGPGPELVELAEFERLVMPARNPVLSDYFVALTGITNARLRAEAGALADAVDAFAGFAAGDPLGAFGGDGAVLGADCARRGLVPPFAEARLLNLRPAVCRAFGLDPAISSAELPAALGLAWEGAAHHAVDDARAVAAVLRLAARRGLLAGILEAAAMGDR